MKSKPLYKHMAIVSFGLAALLMSGCATTQENPTLNSARDVFINVQSDPNVNRYAPLELQEAKVAVENAQRSWESGNDAAEVDHLAYLARQKSLIAGEVAAMKLADNQLVNASAERNRVLLAARTKEAEKSLSQAEIARREAETQRLSAEEQRRVAEDAMKQAQQRAAEAEKARQEALAEAERARKLEAQVADLEARQTERGLVLTLGDVLFDTGKSDLKAGAYLTIEKLAAFLKEYPARRVQIEGFTDSVGSDEYNLGLSIRRAEAVRNALYGRGIALDRIQYRGYGKMYPVAGNDTAAGRQRNRRVEIIISDEKGLIPDRIR